jgi:hypothetical protein
MRPALKTSADRPTPPADPLWLPTLAEEVAWDRRDREYETETDEEA